MKRLLACLLALLTLLFSVLALGEADQEIIVEGEYAVSANAIVAYGYDYYSTDEVALYLCAFWELPPNFITKQEAIEYGWDARYGNLWEVAEGFAIGGDTFGNREGLLPKARGRKWFECDVNYDGGYRGGERIVFSSDGLIYYTGDHYNTFTLLFSGWYGNDDGAYTYPPADGYSGYAYAQAS